MTQRTCLASWLVLAAICGVGCEVFTGIEEKDHPAAADDSGGLEDASVDTRADAFDAANDADASSDGADSHVADSRADGDSAADTLDAADIGDATTTDAPVETGPDTAPDTADGGVDVADTADTFDSCVCSPGTTETLTGVCPHVGDVQQHTCASSCAWGPASCVTPSGWRTISIGAPAWTTNTQVAWDGAGGIYAFDGSYVGGDLRRYDIYFDSWETLAPLPTNPTRVAASVVWAGDRLFVWGGRVGATRVTDGYVYAPSTNTWTAIPAGPLSARDSATAIWSPTTGDVLVWAGGLSGTTCAADGAAYHVATNTWTSMPSSPLPSSCGPTAFWTGSKMLIYLGWSLGDGATYDPGSTSWGSMAAAPTKIYYPNAIAFGEGQMVAVDGATTSDPAAVAGGARYVVASDGWYLVDPPDSTVLSPSDRSYGQSWIAAGRFWLWSGHAGFSPSETNTPGGAALDLTAGTWAAMSDPGTLSARTAASVVSLGKSAFIWGGLSFNADGTFVKLTDGAIFTP